MAGWPLRILVYGAGEAVNGASALASQIQTQLHNLSQVATNRSVAALAQLDASDVPTQRQVLDPQGRQPVYSLPNVDVGDPAALLDFVRWSVSLCPADRTVLMLSGHGAAWQDSMVTGVLGPSVATSRGVTGVPVVPGAVHHPRSLFGENVGPGASITRAVLIDGHDRDYLSNAELGSAVSDIRMVLGEKIDTLVFDACLMSSWEILQELSDGVDVVVASIDELSAAGIDISATARQLTVQQGAATGQAIGTMLATGFKPQTSFDSCVAVDLSRPDWAAAVQAFRSFCAAALPWVQASTANADAFRQALRTASTSLVEYSGGGLADVSALAAAVAAVPGMPAEAVSGATAAATAVRACVLARSTGADYRSATGLSVFAPGSVTVYGSNRSDYIRLQFSVLSGWGGLLDQTYGLGDAVTRFISGIPVQEPAPIPTPLPAPVPAPATTTEDAEFVVSLGSLELDQQTVQEIETAINRAVLDILAELDLLGGISLLPPDQVTATRSLSLAGIGPTMGLVIVPHLDPLVAETRGLPGVPPATAPTGPVTVSATGTEFRVVLHGIPLDSSTVQRLDAAIRGAALQVIAGLDHGTNIMVGPPPPGPETRSILGTVREVLGLILQPPSIQI